MREFLLLDHLERWQRAREQGLQPNLLEWLRACPPPYRELLAREYLLIEDAWEPEPARAGLTEGRGLTDPLEERIGPYLLLEEIGRGGQAIVYRALDTRLGREVALKVLERSVAAPAPAQRLMREAEALSKLQHPGICAVHDVGEADDGRALYVAMQLVSARSLKETLDERRAASQHPSRVDVLEQARLVEKIARTLHAAHEAGIVHRDIKPANLVVDEGGEPIILDFGIAHIVGEADPTLTSRVGRLLGSSPYMAPEVVQAPEAPVDRGVDIYALGVTLFESLTLRRPFDAPTLDGLYRRILNGNPPCARGLNPVVSRDLAAVVSVAMDREPTCRYPTALALAEDLVRFRNNESVLARPPGPWRRLARWCARNRPLTAGLAATALLLVVALVTSLFLLRSERQARGLADRAVVSGLLVEAEDLWPRREERAPDMEVWLDRARDVLSRKREHDSADPVLIQEWSALSTLIRDVEARRSFAIQVRMRTTVEEQAAWQACIADVRERSTYRDLELRPHVGLVPLGRDAASGFWEFWHVGSGDRPRWEGSREAGRVIMEELSGIVLVLLPRGTFWMGAQKDSATLRNYDPLAERDEGPVEEVVLAPFFVSKYEMTQAQWLSVHARNPSFALPTDRLPPPDVVRDSLLYPVESILWNEAQRGVNRLGLQLPTEAQWEYAARGLSSAPWWCGSNVASLQGKVNLSDRTVQASDPTIPVEPLLEDGCIFPAAVGAFPANAFGLHEVHGSVAEWCRDRFAPYATVRPRPGDGLRDDPSSPFRVIRGGGFVSLARECRAAHRVANIPGDKNYDVGVRPVCALDL